MKLPIIKLVTLVLASMLLSGCFGGTIAQQIARSILMHGADKVTEAAFDAQDRNERIAAQNITLKNTELDKYQIAFLNSGFDTIQPQVEALPQVDVQTEAPVKTMQTSKLVNVEVWNLLIGDEKQHLLEKERLQGSTLIPPKEEWSQWQIAVGATGAGEGTQTTNQSNTPASKQEQAITFLVPPDIGRMHSGAKVLVEVSNKGELNIARYSLN